MNDSTDATIEGSSTTIYLDSLGDLKLLVKDTDQQLKTLLVSSNAMCLASPVWRAMLNPEGHFKEAKEREVEFPEDDLDALLIILRIAHLKFRQLPESVTFEELVNLAVVCDKYDTVGVVRKWLPEWLAPWYGHDLLPDYEEWLSIAWTNGDLATFQKLTKHLVLCCDLNGTGGLLRDGKLFTISIVPNIIDQICKARQVLITALLEFCSKLVDCYRARAAVCRYAPDSESDHDKAEEGRKCDTIIYGSLIRGLEEMGISHSAVTSSDIRMSVSDMMCQLQLIRCYTLGESAMSFLHHFGCTFTAKINKELDRIKDHVMPLALDVAIDKSHRTHMEEQARK